MYNWGLKVKHHYNNCMMDLCQRRVSCCVVRLWSLQTFTAVVCFKGHNYPVWSVEFRWVEEMIGTCGGFVTIQLVTVSLSHSLSLSLSLCFPPPKPSWVLLCDRFPWQDCQSMEHRPHSAPEDIGRTSQWCWCTFLPETGTLQLMFNLSALLLYQLNYEAGRDVGCCAWNLCIFCVLCMKHIVKYNYVMKVG